MPEVKAYHLSPTPLIPNSPRPLLHYPSFFSPSECNAANVHEFYTANNWSTRWVARYGPIQRSHYHSKLHECMVVLSGKATIRFGVADTVDDMRENSDGDGYESGGLELEASPGDVFILPAGTAHKTYRTEPETEFRILSKGGGQRIDTTESGGNVRKALESIQVDGFVMIGAYPDGSGNWDSPQGGEDAGAYERVWAVPKPDLDPVLGNAAEGLMGQWK